MVPVAAAMTSLLSPRASVAEVRIAPALRRCQRRRLLRRRGVPPSPSVVGLGSFVDVGDRLDRGQPTRRCADQLVSRSRVPGASGAGGFSLHPDTCGRAASSRMSIASTSPLACNKASPPKGAIAAPSPAPVQSAESMDKFERSGVHAAHDARHRQVGRAAWERTGRPACGLSTTTASYCQHRPRRITR